MTATCITCRGALLWQECPTGGWWIHEQHPDDDHDVLAALAIGDLDDWESGPDAMRARAPKPNGCARCGHSVLAHAGDKDCMCGACMWFEPPNEIARG